MDPFECESFDPFKVPTVRMLMEQIDRFDGQHDAEAAKTTPGRCPVPCSKGRRRSCPAPASVRSPFLSL
jgi:hypothetical protein